MNEHPSRRDRLLADVFQSDGSELPGKAARAARRRRARRKVLVTAGTCALAVLVGWKVWPVLEPAAHLPKQEVAQGRAPGQPSTASLPRGYEIISDAELMENLNDRSVIIVKRRDGRRQVLVLDGSLHRPAN